MNPRASVLIPTHDHPTTLPLTVDTVLRQSVTDLEVLLIGDGVSDRARTVIDELVRGDDRVRFLDFPKGPHHGEVYRHDAIEAARSDALFYLCDDDLLLPEHVADLLALLEDHDLVQCSNGYVDHTGGLRPYADDLADEKSREMHLRDLPRYNSISITGTAHSRLIYEKVGDPWDTTPEGWWPDHYQFRKLLREPSCRAATSQRMTALQLPTSDGREEWSAAEREAELLPWHALVTSPGAQEHVDRLCAEGAVRQLIDERRSRVVRLHELMTERREREDRDRVIAELRGRLQQRSEELKKVRGRLRLQRQRTRRLRDKLDQERRLAERRWSRRARRRLSALVRPAAG